AVSMGNVFSIDNNDVGSGGVLFGNPGITVVNVVANSDNNATASMTNTFSIDDNHVSGGIVIVDEALNGTSSSPVNGIVRMSNAITIDRNTVAGDTFGVAVFDIGFNTGGTVSLSSALDLEQNVISAQVSSGMFFLVDSVSSAVSQGAQL